MYLYAEIERVDEAEEKISDPEIPEILQPLLEEDWIDLSSGIKNSGDPEAYIEQLNFFYKFLDKKVNEIEELYSGGSWKEYTIKVHALKSSARLIGATAFGEEAQLLENAGKSGNLEYVHENHKKFITKYRGFKAPLAKIFFKEEEKIEKQEADPDLLETVYEEILSAAEEMDIERLESIFNEMSEYSIPESEEPLWEELMRATEKYDYDKITEILT